MKKLTILVDLDDTIEDLMRAWVDALNSRHGTRVTRKEIVDWDLSIFFPDLTDEQVYAPLTEDGFWKTVRPLEGAAEYLQMLKNDGHKVLIVTASDYRTLPSKMDDVLFYYFPMITWDDVIVTTHKQLIRGDVLVDDAIHNLINGDYEKLLMDAPHNRWLDAERAGMHRVKNWSEVYTKICEISQS